MKAVWQSFVILLWTTLLTGFIYPLIVMGFGQLLDSKAAGGSLLIIDEQVRGSTLIGQNFKSAKYFWSRPSAGNYNTLPSTGSNLGPTSLKLQKLVEERRAHLMQTHGVTDPNLIPPDLLFASGSGLDPNIIRSAAVFQIERVAKARGKNTPEGHAQLLDLINGALEKKAFNLFGRESVNVLLLNKALDDLTAQEKQ